MSGARRSSSVVCGLVVTSQVAGRNPTEEVLHEPSSYNPSRSPMKTMAIRLDEPLHAQLTVIAQLQGLTATDVIRQAIADYLAARRQDPTLAEKAVAIVEAIDEEAASRRDAIATLFQTAEPADAKPVRRTRKTE
jgi:predicted transcriptional regulator